MARVSPLLELHEQAGAMLRPYGPPEAGIVLVEALDAVETEYAALRKGCVMLDQPQRGSLQVRGADRLAFLGRMVTQELKGFEPFRVRRSFWLNRKGRIDADLRLIELGDRVLIDVDAHAAARTTAGLSAFLFSEDVQIEDQTEAVHRLALHGPRAIELLGRFSKPLAGPALAQLQPGMACVVSVETADGAHEVIVDRQDSTGEIGLELLMAAAHASPVYEALSALPERLDDPAARLVQRASTPGKGAVLARRVGWHAYNIARIEAGWPLYYLDFGPDSLPHETGVLADLVCFTKGCYLGQEVVARMQSLGHPKQQLVGLKVGDEEGTAKGEPRQPMTGSAVYAPTPAAKEAAGGGAGDQREIVGAVTSSAISPMLGGAPICLAMVKYKHIAPGTNLEVEADDSTVLPAQVQASLVFWKGGLAADKRG